MSEIEVKHYLSKATEFTASGCTYLVGATNIGSRIEFEFPAGLEICKYSIPVSDEALDPLIAALQEMKAFRESGEAVQGSKVFQCACGYKQNSARDRCPVCLGPMRPQP